MPTLATLLDSAPAIGAPLPEWAPWLRARTEADCDALAAAAWDRLFREASEPTRARVRRLQREIATPIVYVAVLRAPKPRRVRLPCDGRPPRAWRDCGPTARACEGRR